jgi:hypothetical protein
MRRRIRFLFLLVIAGLLTVAACSSSGNSANSGNGAMSPKELSSKALAAFKAASSVHVTGNITQGSSTTRVDLQLGSSGGKGTITVSGATVQILSVGGSTYFQAPDSLYKQFVPADKQSTVLPLLRGKWVRVPAGSTEFGDLVSLANKDAFVNAIQQNSGNSKNLQKGPAKTVDGVACVSVVDPKQKVTVYVQQNGTPYPVEVDEGSQGSVHFSDWNKPVSVSAPSASDIVDLSQLGAG